MNRTLFALAALAALSAAPAAFAQDLPKSSAELEKMLGLTPEQKKRIAAIDGKYNPKAKGIADKYTPQFQAMQKQMVELQKRYLSELKPVLDQRGKEVEAVLTPQQREQVKKLDSQLKQRMSAAQKPPAGGAPR